MIGYVTSRQYIHVGIARLEWEESVCINQPSAPLIFLVREKLPKKEFGETSTRASSVSVGGQWWHTDKLCSSVF